MITEFLINWWAIILSFIIFLIVGFTIKWNFFPPTPAPGWIIIKKENFPHKLKNNCGIIVEDNQIWIKDNGNVFYNPASSQIEITKTHEMIRKINYG